MTNFDKIIHFYMRLRAEAFTDGSPNMRDVMMIAKACAWMDVIDAVAAGAPDVILGVASVGIEAHSAGLAGEIAADYAYCRLGDMGGPLTDCRLSPDGLFNKDGSLKEVTESGMSLLDLDRRDQTA